MTNTINTVSDVNDLIAKFQKARNNALQKSEKFHVKGRSELYAMLGELKLLCDDLLDPANAAHTALAMKQRQVKPAQKGKNRYGPIIKMVFGDYDYDAKEVTFEGLKEQTPWVPDRSAEKYASVMYWFELKGITSDYVGALENNPEKMDGAIKEVRAHLNPTVVEDESTVSKRIELLVEESSFTLPEKSIELPQGQGRFGALWFDVAGGKVRIRGLLPISEDTLQRQIAAIAKEQETALNVKRSRREAEEREQREAKEREQEVEQLAIRKAILMADNPTLMENMRKQFAEQRSEVEG